MTSSQQTPSDEQLKSFNPFTKLPPRILRYVAEQCRIDHHFNGVSFIQSGETEHEVAYLLKGDVKINCDDGSQLKLSADDGRSNYPLSIKQPHTCTVTAVGSVAVVKITRELLQNINQMPEQAKKPDQKSIEIQEDDESSAIQWDFYREIQAGKIELPSLPTIAMRIAKAINDPNTDSNDIARIIQMDPPIAAHLISVVNSPAYRASDPIDNLPDAVLPEFRKLSAKRAQNLLENLDKWLAKHDRDVNPTVQGTGRNIAGLGIYYFEEPNPSEDKNDEK